jgi:hypothetical protein
VEEQARNEKNSLNYDKTADVSPSYYRTGDVTTGATPTMLSGKEEREKGLAPAPQPSGDGPKFCPTCGAPNAGGKFCGECGFKW